MSKERKDINEIKDIEIRLTRGISKPLTKEEKELIRKKGKGTKNAFQRFFER